MSTIKKNRSLHALLCGLPLDLDGKQIAAFLCQIRCTFIARRRAGNPRIVVVSTMIAVLHKMTQRTARTNQSTAHTHHASVPAAYLLHSF